MRSILIGAALALGACSAANGEEDDRTAQRDFQVADFNALALSGSHEVIVTVGNAASVRAEGPERALERLEIAVENGTLRIGTREGRGMDWFGRHRSATIHITVPALTGASVTGSGEMRIDRIRAENFAGSVSGSGELLIASLETPRAAFSVTGSGDLVATGAADEVVVQVTGSGDAGLGSLRARRAQVAITGSGDVGVHATELVRGRITGSGELLVDGGARCEVSRTGSGTVRCGGAA